jgi:hypothetical protein
MDNVNSKFDDPLDTDLESAVGGLAGIPDLMQASYKAIRPLVAAEELVVGEKVLELDTLMLNRARAASVEEVARLDKELFTKWGITGGTYVAETTVATSSAKKIGIGLGITAVGGAAAFIAKATSKDS